MAGSHAATGGNDSDWLTGTFMMSAAGATAGALGVFSAPMVTLGLGAVAAVAGIGLLGRALSSGNDDGGNSTGNVALVAAITAAVTSFVVGLPMEFLSEAVVFPWAHDTAFGSEVMQASGEVLVPIYDTIGSWFGIEPFGTPVADVPVADI